MCRRSWVCYSKLWPGWFFPAGRIGLWTTDHYSSGDSPFGEVSCLCQRQSCNPRCSFFLRKNSHWYPLPARYPATQWGRFPILSHRLFSGEYILIGGIPSRSKGIQRRKQKAPRTQDLSGKYPKGTRLQYFCTFRTTGDWAGGRYARGTRGFLQPSLQ